MTRFRLRPATAAAALAIVGCAGDGCTGCVGVTPGGFPPSERVENAIQVRVTELALQSIEADPAAFVGALLGSSGSGTGAVEFPVPSSCGTPRVCCDDDDNPIEPCGPVLIDLTEQESDEPRLELTPHPGEQQLDVLVRTRLRSLGPIPFSALNADCEITIDSTNGDTDHIRIALQVQVPIDDEARTTRLLVADPEVSQFETADLVIEGNTFCDILDFGFVKTFIIGQLQGTLEDTLVGTLEDATCKKCPSGEDADCGPFASCDDGVCMKDGDCYQEVGVAGRLPGSALSGISSGHTGAMDIYDVAGGYSNTDGGGLALGLFGGALPGGEPRDRCGPAAARPAAVTIPPSAFFQGNTRPDTGAPYHVGIGLHAHNLELVSWAAYESGFLCLNVGTDSVALLNTDTLAVLFPSIVDLMHGENGKVVLGVRPQAPPAIVLGAGTTTTDPNSGEEVIDEPLLDISFTGLEIDFYVMVDDQFIRVLTLAADVHLPINLDIDDEGRVAAVLGEVEDAFTNVSVTNSEALVESRQELEDKFPALLDLALPVLGDALAFDLPAIGGLRLEVAEGGIGAVDNKSFLAIYANFALAPAVAARRVDTEASLARVSVPDAAVMAAAGPDRGAGPELELALGGHSERGAALEWSYRINGGMWSPYTQSRRVTLRRDALWLQGRHEIQVRAREVGKPATTDATPVVLHPVIDRVPPRAGFAQPVEGKLWVVATDNVSRGALDVDYRLGDGAWQRASRLPLEIDLGDHSPADLEVRVRDESGNEIETTPVAFHGTGGGGAGCNCRTGGRGGPGAIALVALAIACAARRRRWRGLVALGLGLGLALGLTACGGPECATDPCLDGEVEYGPVGRYSSLAVSEKRAVISAYDEQLGDLVLATVDGEELSYRAVDGVPDVLPAYKPSTYRKGVAEPGPDVGAWTSIALRGDKAIIAYQDIDSGDLKVALERDKGKFAIHVVDDGGDGVAGHYASIAVDEDGVPSIAYMVIGLDAGSGDGKVAQLRWAQATTADPREPGDWAIATVDEGPMSCAGLCGSGQVCVSDDPAAGAAGQRCAAEDSCSGGCEDGLACVGGACVAAIPDPTAHDLPGGVGLFVNNLIVDGVSVLVYYDRELGDLVLARRVGGWERQVIDDGGDGGDHGHAATAAVSGQTIHIAYQDAVGDQLLYTSVTRSGVGPVETVDDGVREGESRTHPVGAGAAIWIDAENRIRIAYQDGATSDLLGAIWTPTGWSRSKIFDGPALYGFWVAAASSGGRSLVSSYFYDRSVFPSGELIISTVP